VYLQDAAIRVRALSRWNNYYVAGIKQMMRDFGADGVYLDEIAYDRQTMMRVRSVLGDGGVIDHHANSAGDSGGSPSTNYMELFPFIDRLWYGEGFNYNTPKFDYWLVEISGVPSGLSADMLRYTTGMAHTHGQTRYHYRGMLVGSAFRYTAADSPFNPTNLWRLWDAFAIQNATMVGWWEDVEQGQGAVPIQVSNTDFKATAFVQAGKQTMVAIADFSSNLANYTSTVSMQFDWSALGLDGSTVRLHVPAIPPFQLDNLGVFDWNHTFSIGAEQGGLLLIVK